MGWQGTPMGGPFTPEPRRCPGSAPCSELTPCEPGACPLSRVDFQTAPWWEDIDGADEGSGFGLLVKAMLGDRPRPESGPWTHTYTLSLDPVDEPHRARWWVHNLVAHPMLVLCPPLGRWLHDRTEP